MQNQHSYLQGIWKEYYDEAQTIKKKDLFIRGFHEKEIIDKILNSTSENGIIEIYKVQLPDFQVQPLKSFRVCRDLEPCCI